MDRDILLQVALIAVTAGVSGAAFAVMLNIGFKSDDVFAFGGALVGAAGTVAGAAWLSDRTARKEREAEKSFLVEEFTALRSAAAVTYDLYPSAGTDWPEDLRTSIHVAAELAKGAKSITKEALAHGRTFNFRQRARLVTAQVGIDEFVRFYYDCFGEYDLDPQDERDWPSTLSYLIENLDGALEVLKHSRVHRPASSGATTIANDPV